MVFVKRTLSLCFTALALAACGGPEESPVREEAVKEDPFSSEVATLLMFELDGEVIASSRTNPATWIEDQMLYTIGQLNGNRAVGRLDALELTNVRTDSITGGYRISYHAKLPVAWGSKTNLPTSYEFILPRDITSAAQTAFTNKYVARCVDSSAHDVDAGSMWYYYRPANSGCTLDPVDVVRFRATVTRSNENTTGKYPEYHKIWEDSALNVVSIFGKYEDGATTGDAGISAYNRFIQLIRSEFPGATVEPANLPSSPGVQFPDVTVRATRDGRTIEIHALLVDNVVSAGAAFDERYASLSTEADMIFYNGHAGLGSNVRALVRKGRFRAEKYQLFFMNGCDTFAYVDGYLAEARARLNPDDPSGTKYMEILTNAMPSYFASNATNDLALIRGMLAYATPRTYNEIFRSIDSVQIVVVTGEEDNVYYPGYDPNGGRTTVLDQRGSVGQNQEARFETAALAPGEYIVTMSHDATAPGGDADLYVRVGSAPTTSTYDCRPYDSGSNETCRFDVTGTGTKLYLMVRGYSAQANAFTLTVVGEGTNTPPVPMPWAGLNQSGTVLRNAEQRFETPELAAGRYVFAMTGTGDADLYVRTGQAPTTTAYDCRPYASGSAETCTINLSTPGKIHVMVRGYATSSTYTLTGRVE